MYEIREVMITQGKEERSVWVIDFHDEKYEIISEFLMTDAPMMDYHILTDLEEVLRNDKKENKVSGNRCFLHIKKDFTYIEDLFDGLFDDFETYPSVEVETNILKDLIVMWREKTEK
ncbi:MAG TPA: hypothetical protein VK061_08430 [Bacillota bacterium]|nr:hypothetical protein [Bacillota bacterium]